MVIFKFQFKLLLSIIESFDENKFQKRFLKLNYVIEQCEKFKKQEP